MKDFKKLCILEIYEVDEKTMKEYGLVYKNRVKAYQYATGKIIDFAIPQRQLNCYYEGLIIRKEIK